MQFMKLMALAPVAALVACQDAPEAEAPEPDTSEELAPLNGAPAPDPVDPAPPPPGDDGELGSDRVMQGRWFARTMAGMDAALFGPPESEAAFSVRCDADAGELIMTRLERVPAGEAEMRLMAGGVSRTIAARSTPDPLPRVTGRLPADDRFAGRLAEPDEPIAVAIGGGPSFRMPASQALRQVVSGCGAS